MPSSNKHGYALLCRRWQTVSFHNRLFDDMLRPSPTASFLPFVSAGPENPSWIPCFAFPAPLVAAVSRRTRNKLAARPSVLAVMPSLFPRHQAWRHLTRSNHCRPSTDITASRSPSTSRTTGDHGRPAAARAVPTSAGRPQLHSAVSRRFARTARCRAGSRWRCLLLRPNAALQGGLSES
jgi:hypothetical protein